MIGAAVLILLQGTAPCQDDTGQGARQGAPQQGTAARLAKLKGRKILGVRVLGSSISENVVLGQLSTTKGRTLDGQTVSGDLAFLWKQFKLQMRVWVEERPDGVFVYFATIKEFFRYDQTVFRGLGHFSVEQVRSFLGLDEIERLTQLTAESLAEKLKDRYRNDGYANVNIRIRTDRKSSTITFFVDEGPRARVTGIRFLGNRVYAARSFLGLGLTWNLIGSAGVKSVPGIFSDEPYSAKTLNDDLDRLRTFYRGHGYKDAIVELYKLEFDETRTSVTIVIRVFEGQLYRVESVDIEQTPYGEGNEPLFNKSELMDVIKIKPGDALTADALAGDRNRLSLFYGRRGFPSAEEHDLDRESSFRVLPPAEIVDPERARVKLIYRVREGKRKRLRDVNIRGNRYTRDEVIRRWVSVMPGEYIDMEELKKSQDRLFSLRYFGDIDVGDPGVAMRLKQVPDDPELVDLDIDVTEGRTGKILWGVGISSNTGLFGNVQYDKRNFDWRRTPTSLNPVEWFRQILDNRAFHGGGQSLQLDLSPGTEVSQASINFFEPDIFGTHLDMIGLRLAAHRRIVRFDTYSQDTTGGRIEFVKSFGHDLSVSASLSDQFVEVSNIDAVAPAIVWEAEGRRELRAMGLGFSMRDLDRLIQPRSGYRFRTGVNYAPAWLGGEVNYWKAWVNTSVYLPIYRDAKERAHVLEVRNSLYIGRGTDGQRSLYLTERFFMGGQNQVRGFDYRRAGPTQFGRPTGGETRYLGSLEYSFPLFSSRLEAGLEDTELIRGVFFMDGGMLGDDFDDPLFRQLRLSAGFGVRIRIPGLGPFAFDFGWPILRQDTDHLEVFSFTFRFN